MSSKSVRNLSAAVLAVLVALSIVPTALLILPIQIAYAQVTPSLSLSSDNLNPRKVLTITIRGDLGPGPLPVQILDETGAVVSVTWADGTVETYFEAWRVAANLYVAYIEGPNAVHPANPYPRLSPTLNASAFARVSLTDDDRGKVYKVWVVGTDLEAQFTYDTVKMTLEISPKEFAYRREEAVLTLTIKDMDLNLDPTAIDDVNPAAIKANVTLYRATGGEVRWEGDLSSLTTTVKETAPNSGEFKAKVEIRTLNTIIGVKISDGDKLVITLLATGAAQGWDDRTIPDQRGSDYARAVYRAPTVKVTFTSQYVVVSITSPDDNVDPEDVDTLDPGASVHLVVYDEYGKFYKYTIIGADTVRETGKNTGVFEIRIPVSWGTVADLTTSGVVLQVGCKGPFYFYVRYYVTGRPVGYNIDARGAGVYEPEIASLEIVKATPRTIWIKVKDADLNNREDAIDFLEPSYTAVPSADLTLSKSGVPVARIVLLDTRGTVVAVRPGTDASQLVSFVETDMNTGVFDLKINATLLSLTPGAQYVLRYYDYTGEEVTVFKDYIITVTEISISLDRTEIPVNRGGVVVYFRYVNDIYNIDPTRRETVTVNVSIYAVDGTRLYTTTRTLSETGINTGVFSGGWLIPGYLFGTPRIIDAKIVVHDPNYPDIKAEGRFRAHDASIEVTPKVVPWGAAITIKVKDPDANTDIYVADTVTVEILYGTRVIKSVELEETDTNSGEFVGEVTVSWDDSGFVDIPPGTVLTVRYVDGTPVMSPTASEWAEVPYVDTFKIAATDGTLTVSTAVEGYLGVLEELRLDNITVVDPDMNFYRLIADSLTNKIAVSVEGVPEAPTYTLVETEANSGKFILPRNTVISLANALTRVGILTGRETPRELAEKLAAYVGRKVTISYIDDYSATGTRNIVTITLTLMAWDAEVSVDKEAVNVGDWLTITIRNPEIAGTAIAAYRQVIVKSTSYPAGLVFYAEEVAPGMFQLKVQVVSPADWVPGAKQIPAKLGDEITIEYVDPVTADGKANVLVTKTVRVGVYVPMPGRAEKVSFVDVVTGQVVTPKVGKEVFLTVTLKNTDIVERTMTVIVVVRDPNGVAVARFAATVTLGPGASTEVSFGWTPIVAGSHTVEVYIVKSLADRTPVGEPATFEVAVEE